MAWCSARRLMWPHPRLEGPPGREPCVLEARRPRVAGGFRDDKNVQWRLALIGVFLINWTAFRLSLMSRAAPAGWYCGIGMRLGYSLTSRCRR
jgi:hypothetical protein